MQEYKVENHVSSYLPDGRKWRLVWNDEFDGKKGSSVDETKWDYRLAMMGRTHQGFGKKGVVLDGESNCVFSPYEEDGKVCTTQLQTGCNYMDGPIDSSYSGNFTWPIAKIKEPKFLKKYGYFECRCKLQQREGWWTAFWLQSPCIGSTLNTEISGIENDIMEAFHPNYVNHHANHYNGYGSDHQQISMGGEYSVSADEYHTFGMLWTKEGYTFYVDGKEDGHIDSPVSHIPQFILLSAEVNGWRHAEEKPTEEARLAVGDKFIVDYVRVFDFED